MLEPRKLNSWPVECGPEFLSSVSIILTLKSNPSGPKYMAGTLAIFIHRSSFHTARFHDLRKKSVKRLMHSGI